MFICALIGNICSIVIIILMVFTCMNYNGFFLRCVCVCVCLCVRACVCARACDVCVCSVVGLPESVEDVCPEMPRLDGLMKDINDMSESGARYTEMPHVIEVVLPMLCNYLSYWWERGPENRPASVCSSTVTSEHLSLVLGNILKILNSNLGIDEASWMKRIAGDLPSCISVTNSFYFSQHFSV